MNRVASTVSAEENKKQSSRMEEFSRVKGQLNASETCMSFKRSGTRELTNGNCNDILTKKVKNGSSSSSKEKQVPSRKMRGGEEQALKRTKVYYCSQDAGDMGAKQEDKDKNIKSHFTHVHPKLPDYDDLVAKFKQLKKEKMMSLENKQFEM